MASTESMNASQALSTTHSTLKPATGDRVGSLRFMEHEDLQEPILLHICSIDHLSAIIHLSETNRSLNCLFKRILKMGSIHLQASKGLLDFVQEETTLDHHLPLSTEMSVLSASFYEASFGATLEELSTKSWWQTRLDKRVEIARWECLMVAGIFLERRSVPRAALCRTHWHEVAACCSPLTRPQPQSLT